MHISRFVLWSVVCGLLLAACGAPAPAPTATPLPTPVASSTPTPAAVTGDYSGLASGTTDAGFPMLGEPAAPVTAQVFGSYDSAATRRLHEDVLVPLLGRVRAGEVRLVYIPLSGTGTVADGAAGARAALCAGEQGAFWPYHDALFARLRADGAAATSPAALLDLADEVGLDRAAWQDCVNSDRATAVLEAAEVAAADNEFYAGTPTLLLNGAYMLNDRVAVERVLEQMLARVDTETGQVGNLSTPVYENEEDIPERVEIDPLGGGDVPIPIDITLPPDWEISINDAVLMQDVDALRAVPLTLYRGPVMGGTGYMAMYWGFPSLVAGNPLAAQVEGGPTPEPNLYTDGLRILRLSVVEPGCNVGTGPQRTYTFAGGRTGVGAAWSAVDCPDLPDTRGWFVSTTHEGLNFLFYVYLDPIDPQGPTPEETVAREQLQTILDSVQFRPLAEVLPTPGAGE